MVFRSDPVHDSDLIVNARLKHYSDSIKQVKEYYSREHDNWHVIEGTRSSWWVWKQSNECALYNAKQAQQYNSQIFTGKSHGQRTIF